jgi:hypothetical protein
MLALHYTQKDMKPRKYVSLIIQYVLFVSMLATLILFLLDWPFFYLVGFDLFMLALLVWVNLKPILRFIFKMVRNYQEKKGIVPPRERDDSR